MSALLVSSVCPAIPDAEIEEMHPCRGHLSEEDVRIARRLKRKLIASVVDAVRGRTLVSPATLEAIKDVSIAERDPHRSFSEERAVRRLRAAHRKLGRAPVVLMHAKMSCKAEPVIRALPDVPLVLFNTGQSSSGAPLRFPEDHNRDCARRILGLDNVVRWYMTHHDTEPLHPKMDFLPVGFGSHPSHRGDRADLQLSPSKLGLNTDDDEVDAVAALSAVLRVAYDVSSRTSRRWMDRRLRFLYVCNNRWGGRGAILDRLNASDSMPGFRNFYPAAPRSFFCGALQSLVGLSPGGTAPDGYRHAEFLLAGTVAVLPDHPCIRRIWARLPVIFAEPGKEDHAPLTCPGLMAIVRQFASPNVTFEHGRLTVEFWRAELRRVSFASGGVPPSANASPSAWAALNTNSV